MATIKTAISLDEQLFQRVDATATEMEISRSRLFALAVEDYIGRLEYQKLQRAIDETYGEGPDDTELAVRRAMRRKQAEQRAWEQW